MDEATHYYGPFMKSTTKEEDTLPGLTICFLKQKKTPNEGVWQLRMKVSGVSKCLNEEREGVSAMLYVQNPIIHKEAKQLGT